MQTVPTSLGVGLFAALSDVEEPGALPAEGSCDHPPTLLSLTQGSRHKALVCGVQGAGWRLSHSSHLSWGCDIWQEHHFFSECPSVLSEPFQARQHQKGCFLMRRLLRVICRAQVPGRTLGRLALTTLMGSTWPTGCWLTMLGPSLWPWPTAAVLTTRGGGEYVTRGAELGLCGTSAILFYRFLCLLASWREALLFYGVSAHTKKLSLYLCC